MQRDWKGGKRKLTTKGRGRKPGQGLADLGGAASNAEASSYSIMEIWPH